MTEQPAPDNQEDSRSIFFVEFLEMGSVTFKGIESKNMTPLQLLALSGWLEFQAKSVLASERYAAEQEEAKASEPKIEVARKMPKIEL